MYLDILIKTLILYIFITLSYKVMGKKEMGNLNIIDFIVSILIGEMAAMSIEENRCILESIVPITELVLIEVLLSFITLKNNKIKNIIDGKPILLINNGVIDFKKMKKLRYNLDDLLFELRELNISIDKVKYAVLENNGKLTISNNYPFPIILNNKIDYNCLKDINKDINWIRNETKNIKNIKCALYIDDSLYIINT